jgi:hypothetical protein
LLCDDKPSDDENEHHIDRVVVDEEDGDDMDAKLVKHVTHYKHLLLLNLRLLVWITNIDVMIRLIVVRI